MPTIEELETALEIVESVFADNISRRVVGGDYEEQALKTISAALKQAIDTIRGDIAQEETP